MRDSERTKLARTLTAALFVVAGCSVFDPELYKNAENDAGGGGAPQWAAVSDVCPYPQEKMLSSDQRVNIGTVELNGLADNIQTCGKLTDFNGPDGVVGVNLAAGEKVELAAEFVAVPGQELYPIDLGIYTMGACDPGACIRRVDRCPPGKGERMTFVPDTPGAYYFGFDSKAYDHASFRPAVSVSVSFPRCGDGVLDEGETCDDGNKTPLDGCTDCLAELRESGGVPPVEVEPNNEYATGNVVALSAGQTMLLKGYIGGGCDLDFYLLDVPEGGFPRVTMLGQDGQECPAGTPALTLEFDDPSGVAELGVGVIPATTGGTNYCPQWDENSFVAKALPAGRYTVEMKPYNRGDMPVFTYVLKIEMLAGASGTGGTGGTGGTSGSGGTGGAGADGGA